MAQDLTDIPLAHVCNCVCCILHEKDVESDMLLSHVFLYFPLIETTLILNESLVYEWKVQQHMR
jgi:hypothetical protein